jgi:hypothetical protein
VELNTLNEEEEVEVWSAPWLVPKLEVESEPVDKIVAGEFDRLTEDE